MRPHHRAVRAIFRSMGWEPVRLSPDVVLVQRQETPRARVLDPIETFAGKTHLDQILRESAIDCVLDVGAHRGGFGQRLRQVGYHADIVSFEPNAEVFANLSGVAARDGKWTVHPAAVGNRSGTVTFNIAKDSQFSSGHHRSEASAQFGDMMELVRVEEVPIWTLDDFAARTELATGGRHLLLKVDTQGFDHAVFEGARHLLSVVDAVMFEVPLIAIYEGVPHYTETLRMLEQLGFGVYSLCPIARDAASGCIMEADVILRRRAAYPSA
jgi:FkbM family methyltransferase